MADTLDFISAIEQAVAFVCGLCFVASFFSPQLHPFGVLFLCVGLGLTASGVSFAAVAAGLRLLADIHAVATR